MNLPNYVFKDHKGKLRIKAKTFEDIMYSVQISFSNDIVFIEYYGENHSFLDDDDIKFIIKKLCTQ